jgi:tRNA dimethylallyltransferase
MESVAEHPLIIIAGPTGSGKSALALHVAHRFDGEVVNCDSVQIYRHFDIGSAKLSVEEREGIPHHLIDVAGPDELFTAGDYCRVGRAALSDIAARGKVPIVAGGTGLYLRALLDGLVEGPARDEELRTRLSARKAGSLHRLLSRLDPVSAARIHANDSNKLIRAMEISLKERTPLSEVFARGRDPLVGFRALKFALDPPRAELYRRLDERSAALFDLGIIEEVRGILARGFPPSSKPFEALGYKQAIDLIEGRLTLEEAVAATQIRTRQYAKRQLTWFRREKDMVWLAGFGGDSEIQASVRDRVAAIIE